jgi:hypothetical protein
VLAWRFHPGKGDAAPSCRTTPGSGRRHTASRTRPRCAAAGGIAGGDSSAPGDLRPTPTSCRSSGAAWVVSHPSSASTLASSPSTAWERSPTRRRASLVAAVVVRIGPGRRRAAVLASWRRGDLAAARAAQLGGHHQHPQRGGGLGAGLGRGGAGHPQAAHHRHQMVAGLGMAVAWPACTARAAASASTGSDVPRRWRAWRSGRLTSHPIWP